MRFFTPEILGPKQSLTPSGFLVCHDVPIARTGEMLYGAGEVPVEPGPDGIVRISRTPDEVFRPETIASFEGAAVTMDHPDDFVGPSNWNDLAVGTVMNVRRGTGIEDDLLLADLMITNQGAIDEVRAGLREVSCGYEAGYEQVGPGRGVQREIIGNHVALVERGRCGPRCAIGDKEPEMKTKDSKTKARTWLDRVRTAFKAQDAEALEEALAESKTGDADEEDQEDEKESKTADAIAALTKTVKALDRKVSRLAARDAEREQETEDDDEEDDETDETTDTIIEAEPSRRVSEEGVDLYTGDSARLIAARAEILAPGVKLPTLDGLKTKDRAAALCKCQRRALDQAYETDAGRAAIAPFLGRRAPDFDAMPAQVVDAIFTGAAELMRAKNNAGSSSGKVSTRDFGKVKTIADINEQNRKFWAGQSNQ
ncbi:DUF2213 domain-containing protein [Burkholderia multivorans]|uniref:DUF2213 domain-containing protein n=1 Tax=Burkholderia multivorans TaxID=87883 RepID=UPI000D009005|nr:DUF2213 domain-containing protein [Burkholderia multivorans]PRF07104.1 hypothetical protein C6Q01_17445 [Burkholderia multivorans]PRF89587.1 hypothetical protein C6Q23_14040 [Burkholderia multivorans]